MFIETTSSYLSISKQDFERFKKAFERACKSGLLQFRFDKELYTVENAKFVVSSLESKHKENE